MEQLCRLLAIETHLHNIGVHQKKAVEIINRFAASTNIGIHASGPDRALEHVPKRNTMVKQCSASLHIGTASTREFAHDFPKSVLRVRIVLLRVN